MFQSRTLNTALTAAGISENVQAFRATQAPSLSGAYCIRVRKYPLMAIPFSSDEISDYFHFASMLPDGLTMAKTF